MTGDEEAIKDTTHHMCITQEPLRKEMQFEHMVFYKRFFETFKYAAIFLKEISTQLLKQVQSSRIFLTFNKLKLYLKGKKCHVRCVTVRCNNIRDLKKGISMHKTTLISSKMFSSYDVTREPVMS